MATEQEMRLSNAIRDLEQAATELRGGWVFRAMERIGYALRAVESLHAEQQREIERKAQNG